MRKPTHARSLLLQQDSQRQDAVVPSRQRRRPNAQRHGVYSRAVILPGEDQREFDELYAELLEEWTPSGPTMRDEVFVLADLRWRRRRLNKYVQTQFSLNTFDPGHPAFDEVWGFFTFMHCLRTEPETCFDHAAKYLRADKINQLKQKYPRSNDQPIGEWVKAVTREIISLSSPATPPFDMRRRLNAGGGR